jgi:hypothetical protein
MGQTSQTIQRNQMRLTSQTSQMRLTYQGNR